MSFFLEITPLAILTDDLIPLQVLFYGILIYTYYHGIIDHSGITFKAQWWQPWQPDAIFHDNHHQYTHVNFGFNMYLWDKVCLNRGCEHRSYAIKFTVIRSPVTRHLPSEESSLLGGYFLRKRQSVEWSIAGSAAKRHGRKTFRESTGVSKKYQRKRIDG